MGVTATDLAGLALAEAADGVSFRVRVQPRGRRNEIVGVLDGALKLRVTAPPVEGKANAAVTELLAAVLLVGRGSVRIVSGALGRDKVVAVAGLAPADVRARLAAVVD